MTSRQSSERRTSFELPARGRRPRCSRARQAAQARVSEAIKALGDEPRPPGVKKLAARDGYRIRVGNYRILYVVDDDRQRIRIFRIGDRKNVYR